VWRSGNLDVTSRGVGLKIGGRVQVLTWIQSAIRLVKLVDDFIWVLQHILITLQRGVPLMLQVVLLILYVL
jgi:hypothetical protein